MSKVILFQGDSITDCGRDQQYDEGFGTGYPLLVKAALGFECPGEYKFYNRGIGGHRIVDLYARIKKDMINLKPDYMSILIGVNDVWHELDVCNGVATDKFEKIYGMMIEELQAALPQLKIIIMEPFALEGEATGTAADRPERWEKFSADTAEKAAAAKRVAEKYDLPFLPLQKVFDEACKLEAPDYWLSDGVHPTSMGHELIKREWLRVFEEVK